MFMEDNNIIAIYNRDKKVALEVFDSFMAKTNAFMNKLAIEEGRYKECDGKKLEGEVVDAMKRNCAGTPFRESDIDLISGQHFPDIVAGRHYGVEVKSTKTNKWVSTGSSIIESTREVGVEHIYMLFGKLGGNPVEFRCKPYQDCLYDIAVTHSPRYLINMDISSEKTIFSKMKVDYDSFRNADNSIEIARKYYADKAAKEGKSEMPWWLSKDVTVPPTLKLWVKGVFTKKEEELFRAQLLMLFPKEICNSDYKRSALWLCTRMGVLKSNIRDLYTAGGKITLHGVVCPRIIQWIITLAPIVQDLLEDEEWCSDLNIYNPELLSSSSPIEKWAMQISEQYPKLKDLKKWILQTVRHG